MIKNTIKVYLVLFLFLSMFREISACTLWGATGDKTQNGMTLVAKNRDWKPDNNTGLELIIPEEGYRYLALVSDEGASAGVKGGINQEGLVIVSASVTSTEEVNTEGKGLNCQVLSRYNTVDSVINDETLLSNLNPNFYLLGDKTKIAVIEVTPDGDYLIKNTANGYLCHANHYSFHEFMEYNDKSYKGSETRFERISYLLNNCGKLLTLQDFVDFSEDEDEGPDNSIWRTGSTPEKARTLASFIVAIPKNGSPEVYLKLANPGDDEKNYNLKLDGPFWSKKSFILDVQK